MPNAADVAKMDDGVYVDDGESDPESPKSPKHHVEIPKVPAIVLGAEQSLGPQVNSLRPSSARYSFGRASKPKEAVKIEVTPGPGAYRVDYAGALSLQGASMGTGAARATCSSTRRSQSKKENKDKNEGLYLNATEAWACTAAAGPSPRIGFGTEPRSGQVYDTELLRACPESRYGNGPGLVYDPDYRKVRPSSAGRAFPRAKSGGMSSIGGTSENVSPSTYQHQDQESFSGGIQVESRRRRGPAFSFGRASRFGTPQAAAGNRTAECTNAKSGVGRSEAGYRARRPPSATFGSATRDVVDKMTLETRVERPLSARLPPKLPHPVLDPRQEILKFDATGRR
mmetsp:Transcript_11857/g.28353  ORF Transcript_11857/g.28353 Transcript_11857/m.28353 type:complete len:341 (-) Transcript_11857:50-1072(-)